VNQSTIQKSTDDAGAQSLSDGVRLGMDVQLLINMFHMKSNRIDAHVEFAGSRFVLRALMP